MRTAQELEQWALGVHRFKMLMRGAASVLVVVGLVWLSAVALAGGHQGSYIALHATLACTCAAVMWRAAYVLIDWLGRDDEDFDDRNLACGVLATTMFLMVGLTASFATCLALGIAGVTGW